VDKQICFRCLKTAYLYWRVNAYETYYFCDRCYKHVPRKYQSQVKEIEGVERREEYSEETMEERYETGR
jgi:hypothetical protein